MKIWLHRISHCLDISEKLLENGYLSIGFSDFANDSFLENTINGDWNFFESEMEKTWGAKKRTRYNLWRFLNEFKENDLVIVPLWGQISIYELIESPKLISDKELSNILKNNNMQVKDDKKIYININNEYSFRDIGFVWKIKPIVKDIPRKDIFDSKLTSRMKIYNTNANITDLKENIERIITQYKDNKLYNFHTDIIESSIESINKTIDDRLTPDKFEQLVKWYLKQIGASDVYIPAKNEKDKENGADADVIATFEHLKVIVYVQVKYHKGFTSDWAIQQISEYKIQRENIDDEYTYIPWVITSAEKYSKEAIQKAREANVRLIDKKEFARMLINNGLDNINYAFN